MMPGTPLVRGASAAMLLTAAMSGFDARGALGAPQDIHREVVEETARTRKIDLRLLDDEGRRFESFVREPVDAEEDLAGVLLLAGFETGRESLDLIDERTDVVLLGMNYPYDGPEPLRGWNLVRAIPALRCMVDDTFAGARAALRYLGKRGDVDPDRIIVVGVSLGSFFAIALASRSDHPDAVVSVYGGGDLGAIARHVTRESWVPGFVAASAARFFFGDLEPLDHVRDVAPRPLLMVNSAEDELIPPRSARALFREARAPKKLLWKETGHMDLFDFDVVRSIVDDVVQELAALGLMQDPGVSGEMSGTSATAQDPWSLARRAPARGLQQTTILETSRPAVNGP